MAEAKFFDQFHFESEKANEDLMKDIIKAAKRDGGDQTKSSLGHAA